ncbi:chromatin modification-related protein EAF7-like [Brassica napus]|uniref:chromatin modification-related protein EAF7-like n=1 Tax=Brassica napus TaxID=3708 RepID=UPI00207A8BC5|nr:chromatin modification-related protein EAF7-like [Brassica napus]
MSNVSLEIPDCIATWLKMLTRQDWVNGSVDIAVAEAEVDENNSVPGIDATDQEKIEFLTNKVVSLEERVKYLEGLLNIRGETVKETEKSKETEAATKTKVNGQNADYELDENEVLGVYIDAKRKEIAKRKKNGVRPPREVGHQNEDDAEVEVNEKQTQEEEEQQQEDDTKVNTDVDVGAKESGSEKPVKGTKKRGRKDGEANENASEKPVKGTKKSKRGTKDGEANEDASEKPVKGTRKSKRGTKDGEENEDAYEKPVKVTRKSERVTTGKKKGVTTPREVQQQVEDHAETNEDGEGNEDASKKHLIKEHNVGTPKSKKQKKQFEKDSADDVIGSVLEDFKKAD